MARLLFRKFIKLHSQQGGIKRIHSGTKYVVDMSRTPQRQVVDHFEKARDLIAGHECNVTEAAFNVGFSGLSHFTKTFREEFGINPKAFAKEKKSLLNN